MTNHRPLGIPTPRRAVPFFTPPPPLTPCQLLWCNDNKAAYAEKHNSIVWKACTCHCHVIPAHLTIRQRINVGVHPFLAAVPHYMPHQLASPYTILSGKL